MYIGHDPNRTGSFGGWWASAIVGDAAKKGETAAQRARFAQAYRAERQYAVQLRQIARQVGHIVNGTFNPDDPTDPGWAEIERALLGYADLITPWANATAARMLADVSRRDATAWTRLGREISRALHREIAGAPVGPLLRQLQASQVALITSLPREAAERVHELSLEALTGGKRWNQIVEEIRQSGPVSIGHANTIARTETGRASSNFTAVRAQHVGSPGFIWRTARDRDVRELHQLFEGQFYRWTHPPKLDDGRPGLPGSIWNCRCWPEPVLPDTTPITGPRPRNPAYLTALREAGFASGTAFQ
jgi:SPP1 gp7 family putative phage head morphogenesis protein